LEYYFIAGELCHRLGHKQTLILLNRIQLAKQTHDELVKYLNGKIGLMIEGHMDINNNVTVASVQTINALLERDKTDPERIALLTYLYNTTVCVYDECHLLKESNQYMELQRLMPNLDYSIGMTGTPFRQDNATIEMNGMVGFVIYTKTTEELQKEGFISASKAIFYDYSKDASIQQTAAPIDDEGEIDEDDPTFHQLYDANIVENHYRNHAIVKICGELHIKKRILILVNRINHITLLQESIPNSIVIHGSVSSKDRKARFESFEGNEGVVLIGMAQIMSTGINIPTLDIIINATANKSDITTIQSIGRVLRKADGKESGIFIDFIDRSWPFTKNTKLRGAALRQFGHEIIQFNDFEKMITYINK
jgi:superfamily II DNA or RNA helicase